MQNSSIDFIPLFSSLLKQIEKGRTLVVIPWGNVGDEFLRRGMCHLFRSHGIEYDSIHISQIYDLDFSPYARVAWGGGGNVCGRYQTEADVIKISDKCRDFKLPFICFPQSLEGLGSHLGRFETIYLREHLSLSMASETGLNARLVPDFSLAYPHLHHPHVMPLDAEASYFRADLESCGTKEASDPRRDDMSVDEFLSVARGANVIHTDLMHLAIAALKQGRKVFLHRGNWHKIESMYYTWLHHLNCELV